MPRWLMTVREVGVTIPTPKGWPSGLGFDLSPHWITLDAADDQPPPNPSCFPALQHWPSVVEIRRPDGTRLNAELRLLSAHINFAHELRIERDAAGRMRNPWMQQAVLMGLNPSDVPLGSEIWGEVNDEDFQSAEHLKPAR